MLTVQKRALPGPLCREVSVAVFALWSLLQEVFHPGAASEFVQPIKRQSCLLQGQANVLSYSQA